MAPGRFTRDLNKFAIKAVGRENMFLRELIFDIMKEVIELTPVDTGFARASWWMSFGAVGSHPAQPDPARFEAQRGLGAPLDGGMSQAMGALQASRAVVGDVVNIANGAHYIKKLENGGSNQAPRGMVKITLDRANEISSAILARIIR